MTDKPDIIYIDDPAVSDPDWLHHGTEPAPTVFRFSDGVEMAFNPNQPRDENGRWTSGPDTKAVADGTRGLAEPDGGFTMDAATMQPLTTGFAVALAATDKLIVAADAFDTDGNPSKALVRMTRDRLDAAMTTDTPAGTRKAIGGWHNPDDSKVEVNVTAVFGADRRDAAIAFARDNDQIAIADLDAIARGDWDNAIINTGGTGGTRDVDDDT